MGDHAVRAPSGYSRSVAFHRHGAKKWMAPIIERYLPAEIRRLVIPFFGRGDFLRLLRNLGVEAPAIVADIDPELMATHEAFRENPGEVVRLLEGHKARHSPGYYIDVRDGFDADMPQAERAAAFVYLVNGTYKAILKRSAEGKLTNVSAGRPLSCCPAAIYAHSIALRSTTFAAEDFAATLAHAGSGDFLPLDPPYLKTLGFGGLTFGDGDHVRLADACHLLHRKGALFLVTSSDDPLIRRLYRAFNIEVVPVTRTLGEKKTTELVITNY